MAGAQDVQARRPGLTIGFLSLLVIGQADFHIPNMMQVGPVATTTCGVCGTVTPSPGLGPESLRARAKAAAGVAPADGPGPNFQQYQGPRQRTSSDATNDAIFGPTTPAPHSPMGFLHMDGKKLNVPMIAGLATGGAVVAAGVITATVAGVKSHQKQMEKKAKQAQAESGSAPAIQASQGPALAPPHPLPSTFLTKAVLKGDTVIEVASVQGFAVGDTVKIGNLFNTVKGFGSLTLDHPMQHNVQSGAEVQVIREPASVINARVLITTTLDQGQLNMVLGGANPAANQFSARTVVGPTTAPPAGNNTSAMTAFYCVLAGILLCCVFWCLVAAVGIFMNKSKKNRGRDVGKSDYSEVSDEEEDEAEDEEEEEVLSLPSDEEKKEEQEEEEELDEDEEEEQDDVEEGRRKIRPT